MKIFRISSLEEFRYVENRNYDEYQEHLRWLHLKLPSKETSFSIDGYSYPADKIVEFAKVASELFMFDPRKAEIHIVFGASV